jgi:hypothetical protein
MLPGTFLRASRPRRLAQEASDDTSVEDAGVTGVPLGVNGDNTKRWISRS